MVGADRAALAAGMRPKPPHDAHCEAFYRSEIQRVYLTAKVLGWDGMDVAVIERWSGPDGPSPIASLPERHRIAMRWFTNRRSGAWPILMPQAPP